MQAQTRYSRAPITEALIDIRVQLLQKVELDILAQVGSRIQAEYAYRDDVLIFQGEMIAGASVGATANQSHLGYRFFSKDEKQILQVRLDVSSSPKLLVLPKTTLQLQSPEGRQIADLASEIRQSLTVMKQYLEHIENTGETDYNPVPPKRSERVTMRAQFKGRGKPLPYPMDEE